MVRTGKKFIVALIILVTVLGLGWWSLQREPQELATTEPVAKTDLSDREVRPPVLIDPNEPRPDPGLLRETEVSLRLVADSLSAGKDPRWALAMLQSLEQRLASTNSPTQLMALRAAISADRQQLLSSSLPSTSEMRSTLQRMQSEVASLPNLFVPEALGPGPEPKEGADSQDPSQTYWGRILASLEQHLAGVVKIRRVEDRQAVFRTPEQGRMLTEQLGFRLELALIALDTRNQAVFAREISNAQSILSQAFDADSPSVVEFRNALTQLHQQSARLTLPLPEASLRALEPLLAGLAP